MEPEMQTMAFLDWVVMGSYAIAMLLVGWYFSRRTKTSEDYMLGGREMKPWAVGMSLFASLLSAISYLSYPGEVIKYGPMVICILASYPLVCYIVCKFLIPRIMKEEVTSAYELLEVKLGVSVRLLAASLFLLMRLVWMAVIIYLCAEKVLIPIMGWSEDAAFWVSVTMGVITIIYTSMGGLKAVIFTDVVQTIILFGAMILALVLIGMKTGVAAWIPDSWPEGWQPWRLYDPDPSNRISFVSAFFYMFTWFICTAGSDQMAIQRYMATKNVKAARSAFTTSIIVDAVVMLSLGVLGLALFAYFRLNPELIPGTHSIATEADNLFPHFIVIGMPVGLTGLVIAGLFAAAMSSLSSGLNSSCLVITNDFIGRFRHKKLTEHEKVKIAKIVSFAIGVAIVLLSLLVSRVKGNLRELTNKLVNSFVSPLFIPFLMALFFKRATSFGTFWGTIASMIAAGLVSFSKELLHYEISFMWIMPISLVVGVVVSLALSYLTPDKNKQLQTQ